MTVTKKDLIKSVKQELGYSEDQSAEMINSVIDCIRGCLENGEDVLVSGFGKFCVKEKNERKGRNPATGDDMMLAPRKVVTFKCSGTLRDKVNE